MNLSFVVFIAFLQQPEKEKHFTETLKDAGLVVPLDIFGINHKERLNHMLRMRRLASARFETKCYGLGHMPLFDSDCYVGRTLIASAKELHTKKAAESEAALRAYHYILATTRVSDHE